jgi:hypothetical protein
MAGFHVSLAVQIDADDLTAAHARLITASQLLGPFIREIGATSVHYSAFPEGDGGGDETADGDLTVSGDAGQR